MLASIKCDNETKRISVLQNFVDYYMKHTVLPITNIFISFEWSQNAIMTSFTCQFTYVSVVCKYSSLASNLIYIV